jgi:adenosylmethionine-8-amino-7-oxononanoate aminotransferase
MARNIVWHPFTQHAVDPTPTMIARGKGAWLETDENRRIFDGISSWWVITHGHRHAAIVAAIHEQIDKLDQVIFAGFTHEPAEKLADKLVDAAPRGLSHVFFSDSGSTSVEVALKMALGYWRNIGQPRTRIAALEHGYHGDTIGTMSAGARGVFNAAYEPLLFDVVRIPFPHKGREQETLDALDAACRETPLAAFHRRAADRRRRWHADLRRGNARRDEAHLRAPQYTLHRRRGDDRMGPYRHAVCL